MFVIGSNKDTDSKRSKNIEEQDTPENPANCLGNILPRVLSFTCGNGNKFNTCIRESSIHESREKTQESADISS
jgi:hypothetical protein